MSFSECTKCDTSVFNIQTLLKNLLIIRQCGGQLPENVLI